MKFKRGRSEADTMSSLLARVWRANHDASRRYIPKSYAGELVDFRPARQYRSLWREDLKWEALARGGQRVVVIPGYPGVMLVEPYVKHLAVALRASLDEAIGRWETQGPKQDRAVAASAARD